MDSIPDLQVTIGFIPIPNPVTHEELLQFDFKSIFCCINESPTTYFVNINSLNHGCMDGNKNERRDCGMRQWLMDGWSRCR